MDDRELLIRCACGWEARGPEEVVVPATQDHGRRVHNMDATPAEVLALAVAVEPPAER